VKRGWQRFRRRLRSEPDCTDTADEDDGSSNDAAVPALAYVCVAGKRWHEKALL
jgi:hypothetical protein